MNNGSGKKLEKSFRKVGTTKITFYDGYTSISANNFFLTSVMPQLARRIAVRTLIRILNMSGRTIHNNGESAQIR